MTVVSFQFKDIFLPIPFIDNKKKQLDQFLQFQSKYLLFLLVFVLFEVVKMKAILFIIRCLSLHNFTCIQDHSLVYLDCFFSSFF